MDYSRPELADRLAAEYTSGLLRGPARRRFEALLAAHPALRGAVHDWQERLMPLAGVIEPQAPSPEVWQRIEARVHGAAGAATTAGGQPVGWWRQLAFWRGFSAIAGVAALALAVLLVTPGPVRPPVVVVLSAVSPTQGGVTPASFVASISADGRALVTRPLTEVSVQPDHALELWALPATGAPRSLGLISAHATTVVTRDRLLRGATGLAVSLEPPGGSPTGAPTGPVLYTGKLTL